MIAITGGSFQMGSPKKEAGRADSEGPTKEVTVDDFWIGEMEITWDQFELFLYRETDNAVTQAGDISLEIDGVSAATMPYVNFNRPGHPLVNVTNYAAATFCKWLTAKTGNYYRLPTEAEWEYACRAGSATTYSYGANPEELDQYGWYEKNSGGTFLKGGQKKPNAWGLYDMHGNVAEWVLDSYKADGYAQTESTNPLNYEDVLYPHVVRGGSWMDSPAELRSAARGFSDKSWKRRDPQFPKSLWWMTDATHVGFRIVRPKNVPTSSEMEKFWGKPIKEY